MRRPASGGHPGLQDASGREAVEVVVAVPLVLAAVACDAASSRSPSGAVEEFVRGVLGQLLTGLCLLGDQEATLTGCAFRVDARRSGATATGVAEEMATGSVATGGPFLGVLKVLDDERPADEVLGGLDTSQRELLAEDLVELPRLVRGPRGRAPIS